MQKSASMVKRETAPKCKNPHRHPAAGDVARKLRHAVDLAGGPAEIVRKTGMAKRTLASYLAGETEPTTSNLVRIAGACGVHPSQFFAGDPTGLAESAEPFTAATGFVFVPRLNVEAAAGWGRIAPMDDLEGGLIAFREDWLRRIGMSPRHVQAVVAVGDSMEPTIRDGDLLLIDRSIGRVEDTGIYVVVRAGYVLVKRILIRGDGVVLRSDNEQLHDEEHVPAGEIDQLVIEGRVGWVGRAI